jgi:hypothetical protein
MELGGKRDFEEDVLHNVAAVRSLELEFISVEEDIIEAPDLCSKNGRNTLDSAILDDKSQIDSARTGITCGPGLAGHGVGGVAVSTERLTINPSLRNGIYSLLASQTKQLGDNSSGRDLDEHDVVKTNTVEGVLKCETSLDLVSFNHGLKDILNGR